MDFSHRRELVRIHDQSDGLRMRVREQDLLRNGFTSMPVVFPLSITNLVAMNTALDHVTLVVQLVGEFGFE